MGSEIIKLTHYLALKRRAGTVVEGHHRTERRPRCPRSRRPPVRVGRFRAAAACSVSNSQMPMREKPQSVVPWGHSTQAMPPPPRGLPSHGIEGEG